MIGRTLAGVRDTLGGIYELIRLVVITRVKLSGRYWNWRNETAFGRGAPSSRRELTRRLFAYARWAHRIRRLGR